MKKNRLSAMKPQNRDIWKLLAWHLAAIAFFSACLVVSVETFFALPEDFMAIRIGLWAVNIMTLMTVFGFAHYYLLRQALNFHPQSGNEPQSRSLLQDVWIELIHYPYRMVLALVLICYTLMIIMNSVYHALTGASFGQGLTAGLAILFFLSLWIGPLAVLIYVRSESAVRMICALICSPEDWRKIDFTDPRHYIFDIRLKQLIVTVIPLACFLISIVMLQTRYGTFLHPVLIGMVLLVLIYYVYVVWTSAGMVASPVRAMDSVINRILRQQALSDDEISTLVSYTRDEVGRMNHAVFQLCQTIIPALLRSRDSRQSFTDQLEDITSVSRQQHTVSYSQASALSELAATMEQIVQSVNQMASDAMRTSQMTQQGLQEIERGKTYLAQTLDSIDQIYQESLASSQRIMDLSLKMVQIEDVVRIINYVTDHTKILAFNAAIETASAGEVGERFGVVAKEIRQLAQNISDSTEEIKKIINDVKKTAHASVITTEKELKQVNASIKNASDAQRAFNDIHAVIRQASDAVGNISAAVNQQRVVHEQVWSSIKDIDSSARELLHKSQLIVDVAERLKKSSADQHG